MADPALSEQFEDVARVAPLLERWLAETRAPRTPHALLDLIERVAPAAGSRGVDLGAYSGAWADEIARRYRCSMIAVDIAPSPLASCVGTPIPPINADLVHLPLRDDSLDLVWCRDMLSMVTDLDGAIREIARVLRPGAGAVIYTAVTTPRLEPLESADLVEALAMPAWWVHGRDPVDDAIAAAGLQVVHVERFSPEHQEAALLQADPELCHDLAVLGRFERERSSLEALASPVWAGRFRAWSAWPVYLLLGKLRTFAWVVLKP